MRCLVVLATLVAIHRPADACSVTSTFLPPSNFELVTKTPRIVLAKAIGTSLVTTGQNDEVIELAITRVLKGAGKPGDRVDVRGYTLRYMGAGSKTDWSKARKGAYAGSCIAFDYKLDKHYLLFMKEYAGRWQVAGEPFTRVNEEVDPKSDPWTTAVEAYVKIGALPVAQQAKAIDALIAKQTTPTDKAISADLALHRAMPSPYKSFAELDVMLRANPGHGRIVIAIGTGGDQAAKPFMKNLVQSVRDGTPAINAELALIAIGAYYLKVSDPTTLGQIAELYIALGTKQKQTRWNVMWALIKRADASHQGVMERALAGADDEEAGRLVDFFVRSPSAAARKELAKRVGGDYAAKWEMAIGLAGLGDKDVLAWADKMLAAKPGDEHRWIALYAIAMSPLPEADVLAGKVIAKGGEDLEHLVQGYAKAKHARAEARLAELAKSTKLPVETRKWLDRTIAERKDPP